MSAKLVSVGPSACFALSVALSSSLAAAGPALHYQVTEGCPTQAWFEEQLRVSTGGQPTPPGTLRVVVEEFPTGFYATAHFSPTNKDKPKPAAAAGLLATGFMPDWQRELSGKNCGELLEALSFSLSLYWEALAGDAEPATIQPSPATTTSTGETPEAEAQSKAAAASLRDDVFEWDDAAELDPSRNPSLEHSTDDHGLSFAALFGTAMRGGIDPTIGASGSLGIEMLHRSSFPSSSYTLQVEGLLTPTGHSATTTGLGVVGWQSQWYMATVQACPLETWPNTSVSVGLCAGGHLSRYHAKILGNPETVNWLALVSAGPRARSRIGPLLLELDVGGHLPLNPVRVEVQGEGLFRQLGGVYASLRAGLLHALWNGE